MSPKSGEFTIQIKCPGCGKIGASVWETYHEKPLMVILSEGFYERVEKKARSRIQVVCEKCGAVVPPIMNLPKR